MVFPSVYEMFAPLTTVRKQHFWDYFSGATLNSRWTERNGLSGDGTVSTSYAVMADEVNGGVKISSNTGTWGKTTSCIQSHSEPCIWPSSFAMPAGSAPTGPQ